MLLLMMMPAAAMSSHIQGRGRGRTAAALNIVGWVWLETGKFRPGVFEGPVHH